MIFFKYIVKEYLKNVCLISCICLTLFILFDFLHKTTAYFPHYKPSLYNILQFYFYQIPFQVMQFLPLSALIASIIVFINLAKNEEITGLRSFGLNVISISYPFLFSSLILIIIALVLSEWIVPFSSQKLRYITTVEIEKKNFHPLSENLWYINQNEVIHFTKYDTKHKQLEKIKAISLKPNFKLKKIEDINYAKKNAKNTWTIKKIQSNKLPEEAENTINFSYKDTRTRSLPFEDNKQMLEQRFPEELNYREISYLIKQKKMIGIDASNLIVTLYFKYAYILSILFFSVFGIRLGFILTREKTLVRNIFYIFLLLITYWSIFILCRAIAFSKEDNLIWISWFANIFAFIYVACEIKYLYKKI